MVQVGVECGVELIQRLVTAVGAGEFGAGVLGGRGVQQRPRRRVKHVRGSQQAWGVTLEYPAGIPGHPGEQWDRRPLTLKHLGGLQDTRAQAGIAGRHATRASNTTSSKTWGKNGDPNRVIRRPATTSCPDWSRRHPPAPNMTLPDPHR